MVEKILQRCKKVIPEWKNLTVDDFNFDNPKGFSSFTMGVRCKKEVIPKAVLYRHLEGKENAILDFNTEKETFLMLGDEQIAATCFDYNSKYRIEAFYNGQTLESEDLFDKRNLKNIANQLFIFHQLKPNNLPVEGFFDLIQKKWEPLAHNVLYNHIDKFPENEQKMCIELRGIFSKATKEKVAESLPNEAMTFCHNDTYHGNIFKLKTGEIKLLDFEFSCLNHKAYDFSNLFAETVMEHKLKNYPFFKINKPKYDKKELSLIIGYYLDNEKFINEKDKNIEAEKLLSQALKMTKLSDYKYAMAAITLAINPIQKIRFIPYAHQRFRKFINS